MEAHGPLFHRNGASVLPRGLAGLITVLVALVVILELVLGIVSVA